MKFVKDLKMNYKIVVMLLPLFLLTIALVIYFSVKIISTCQDTKTTLNDGILVSSERVLNADRNLYQTYQMETELYYNTNITSAQQTKLIASYTENLNETNTDSAFNLMKQAVENIKNIEGIEDYTDEETGMTIDDAYQYFQAAYSAWVESFDINTYLDTSKEMTEDEKTAYKKQYEEHLSYFTELRTNVSNVMTILDNFSDQHTNELENMIVHHTIIVSILCGVVLLAVFALASYISLLINTSLKRVNSAALKIARGDLEVYINEESFTGDEIGQLAESTSMITARLRNYVQYIREITEVLNTMADGDMRITLKNDYSGEFAPIKTALESISSSLNTTLMSISESTAQVNTGAMHVSGAAQSLSQGAAEQASSVQELAATIAEISSHVKTTSENATKVMQLMKAANKEVTDGDHRMKNMIASMTAINQASVQISKIIQVIDDIAFQTDILALNASVEAARAGAAGKGFAVVADEVRNLAAKSAAAAQDTTELIENSIAKVEDGSRIAASTAESLKNIVDSFQDVASLVTEIDKATDEQSISIDQISHGIDQISAVVQTNSATAEQTAAASEELTGQVSMLNELIGKFKLKKKKRFFDEEEEVLPKKKQPSYSYDSGMPDSPDEENELQIQLDDDDKY